jgi:hypothetical protein
MLEQKNKAAYFKRFYAKNIPSQKQQKIYRAAKMIIEMCMSNKKRGILTIPGTSKGNFECV